MADSPIETVVYHKKKEHAVTVVIAVDGSEYSDYALQFLAGIALFGAGVGRRNSQAICVYMDKIHKPDNHVILVHSSEYKMVTRPACGAMSVEAAVTLVIKESKTEEEKANKLVEQMTEKMKNMQVEFEIARIHGEAGPAVVSLVHAKHADYVVIGCRGKGTVRRTLTGSVTDYVTHHSHVPVIITRHKDHNKQHHGFHLNPFHRDHKHKHVEGPGHQHDDKSQHVEDEGHQHDDKPKHVEDTVHQHDEMSKHVEDKGHQHDDKPMHVEDKGHLDDYKPKHVEDKEHHEDDKPKHVEDKGHEDDHMPKHADDKGHKDDDKARTNDDKSN